jgi:hypothetical protein
MTETHNFQLHKCLMTQASDLGFCLHQMLIVLIAVFRKRTQKGSCSKTHETLNIPSSNVWRALSAPDSAVLRRPVVLPQGLTVQVI